MALSATTLASDFQALNAALESHSLSVEAVEALLTDPGLDLSGKFLQLTSYFKDFADASLAKLPSTVVQGATLTKPQVEFVEDVSRLLGLDATQAVDVWQLWRGRHKASAGDLATPPGSPALGGASSAAGDAAAPTPRDLTEVCQTYHDQRSFLLRTIQTLLRIDALPGRHPYHAPVSKFVTGLIEGNLTDRVLDAFQAAYQRQPTVVDSLSLFKSMAAYGVLDTYVQSYLGDWACQSVREQVLLMETLFLLFWERVKCNRATYERLAKLIASHNFQASQHQLVLLPSTRYTARLQMTLLNVCVLILIEGMQLHRLVEATDADEPHPLLVGGEDNPWEDPLHMLLGGSFREAADRGFRTSGQAQYLGPIVMAWSALTVLGRPRVPPSAINGVVDQVDTFGSVRYLRRMLRELAQGRPSHGAAHSGDLEEMEAEEVEETVEEARVDFDDAASEDEDDQPPPDVGDDGTPYSTVWDPEFDSYCAIVREFLAALMLAREARGQGPPTAQADVVALTGLVATVYTGQPDLCSEFWEGIGRGAEALHPLLRAAQDRYPRQCVPLTTMCASLVGDRETAGQVFRFLGGDLQAVVDGTLHCDESAPALTSFAHESPAMSSWGELQRPGMSGLFHERYLKANVPFHFEGVVIPAGTTGRVIASRVVSVGYEQPEIVSWRWKHSAWPVLLSRLEVIASTAVADGADHAGPSLGEEAAATVGLLAQLIAFDGTLLDRLVSHLKSYATPATGADNRHLFVATREWLCKQLLSLVSAYGRTAMPPGAVHRADSRDPKHAKLRLELSDVSRRVVVASLQALSAVAAATPATVLEAVIRHPQGGADRVDGLDATSASSVGFSAFRSSSTDSGVFGVVMRLLRTLECVRGTYALTLAALRLFELLAGELLKRLVCTDLHSSFAKFDKDGDGNITREEFDKAMRKAGFNLSDVAMAQLLRRLDADGDGSIEYHEFVRFAQVQTDAQRQVEESKSDGREGVAVDKVSQELRAFVQQLTQQTRSRLASDRALLSRIVEFAIFVFTSHASWRYVRLATRWLIGCRTLRVIVNVLRDHSKPAAGVGGTTVGSSMREQLLLGVLQERGLRAALVQCAVQIATSAIRRPGPARPRQGAGAREVAAAEDDVHMLPVNFDAGLIGQCGLSKEQQLVERLTTLALRALAIVLQSRTGQDTVVGSRCPVGAADDASSGVAWRAVAKVEMLTGRGEASSSYANSTRVDGNPQPIMHMNTVIALAGLVGYHREPSSLRIPLWALRVLMLLSQCMAAVRASSAGGNRQQYSIMAYLATEQDAFCRLLFGQRRGGAGDPMTALLRCRAFDLAHVALFTQPGLALLLLNAQLAASPVSSDLRPTTVVHEAMRVLTDPVENLETSPRLVASVLYLLLTLWKQGLAHGRHQHVFQALRTRGIWAAVVAILQVELPPPPFVPFRQRDIAAHAAGEGHLPCVPPAPRARDAPAAPAYTHSGPAVLSPDAVTRHCYAVAARTYALGLAACEMQWAKCDPHVSLPAALTDALEEWFNPAEADLQAEADGKPAEAPHRFLAWLRQFVRLDHNPAVTSVLHQSARDAGLDLFAFRRRMPSSLPTATVDRYGGRFVYDTSLVVRRLGVQRDWTRSRAVAAAVASDTLRGGGAVLGDVDLSQLPTAQEPLAAAWAITAWNCAMSIADAQLALVDAWKTAAEVANDYLGRGKHKLRPYASIVSQVLAAKMALAPMNDSVTLEAMLTMSRVCTSMLHYQLFDVARGVVKPRSSSIPKPRCLDIIIKLCTAMQNLHDSSPAGALWTSDARPLQLGIDLRLSILSSLLLLFRSCDAPPPPASAGISIFPVPEEDDDVPLDAAAGAVLPLVCHCLHIAIASQPGFAGRDGSAYGEHSTAVHVLASLVRDADSPSSYLFEACVALLGVLFQRAPRPSTFMPTLHAQGLLPALMKAFTASTTSAVAAFEAASGRWEAHLGEVAASTPTDTPSLVTNDVSEATQDAYNELMTDLADGVATSLRRAETVLRFFAYLSQDDSCCKELARNGLLRLLLTDAMFRRMETVVHARSVAGAVGLVQRTTSSTLAVGAAVQDPKWWGGGFGLGPTQHRGYRADGSRCGAHRVWLLALEVMSHFVRTLSVGAVGPSGEPLPVNADESAHIAQVAFDFVEGYRHVMLSSAMTRALNLSVFQEAERSMRLVELLFVHHHQAWRLRVGSAPASMPNIVVQFARAAELTVRDYALLLGDGTGDAKVRRIGKAEGKDGDVEVELEDAGTRCRAELAYKHHITISAVSLEEKREESRPRVAKNMQRVRMKMRSMMQTTAFKAATGAALRAPPPAAGGGGGASPALGPTKTVNELAKDYLDAHPYDTHVKEHLMPFDLLLEHVLPGALQSALDLARAASTPPPPVPFPSRRRDPSRSRGEDSDALLAGAADHAAYNRTDSSAASDDETAPVLLRTWHPNVPCSVDAEPGFAHVMWALRFALARWKHFGGDDPPGGRTPRTSGVQFKHLRGIARSALFTLVSVLDRYVRWSQLHPDLAHDMLGALEASVGDGGLSVDASSEWASDASPDRFGIGSELYGKSRSPSFRSRSLSGGATSVGSAAAAGFKQDRTELLGRVIGDRGLALLLVRYMCRALTHRMEDWGGAGAGFGSLQ